MIFWLSRIPFFLHNQELIGHIDTPTLASIMWHAVKFDLVPLAWFNILFILLRFLPFPALSRQPWIAISNTVYYITNSALIALNTIDIALFPFQGTRMRFHSMAQFLDGNTASLLASYVAAYWWAYLLGMALIAMMVWCSRRSIILPATSASYSRGRILQRTGIFLLAGGLTFLAMRGKTGFEPAGKRQPLSMLDASTDVTVQSHANVLLNTPFCILKSLNPKDELRPVRYFTDQELASLRTSVIMPADSTFMNGKNLMLIILESGATVFSDSLNIIPDDAHRGLMPFFDSIVAKSLRVTHNIATGRRSSEGITSILGSFPNFEPFLFMRSPYTANKFDSFPRLLTDKGYSSAFFFGCSHGSYSIDPTAAAMGVQHLRTRESYPDDTRTDGAWGLFDHAMAEHAATDLSSMPQPFLGVWFTTSAHAPFKVPDNWRLDRYRTAETGMERAVEYTDMALERFFEIASQQPWYTNTIFVITADHGNREWPGTKYDTGYVQYHIPFVVYTPDGTIAPRRIDDRIMSQLDIGPTLLGLAGYPEPYVSIGCDILAGDQSQHYAINRFNSQYQIYGMRYMVTWDDTADKITGVYTPADDPFIGTPLEEYDRSEVEAMVTYAKALLQDATGRMIDNRMSIGS